MQTLPEINVNGRRKPNQTPHEFVQSQGVGVPNGTMADDGTASLLKSQYELAAPWAGSQSALGLMPSGKPEGGTDPSLLQNLKDGHYGDALGQAVGVIPEVGPAVAKGAVGLGALYKAMKATSPEVKSALDPSLNRIFLGVDSADKPAQKAIDMTMEGEGRNYIWNETQRMLSPNTDRAVRLGDVPDRPSVVREIDDSGYAFKPGTVTSLTQSYGRSAKDEAGNLINHPELFDNVGGADQVQTHMYFGPEYHHAAPEYINGKRVKGEGLSGSVNYFHPSGHNDGPFINAQSHLLYPSNQGVYRPDELNLYTTLLHELGHYTQNKTGLTGGGNTQMFQTPTMRLFGSLAPYIEDYQQGIKGALIPQGHEIQQQVQSQLGMMFSDAIKKYAGSVTPDELDFLLKSQKTGAFQAPIDDTFDSYYSTWGEVLSRLAEMRQPLSKSDRAVLTPTDSLLGARGNQPKLADVFEVPRTLSFDPSWSR